MKELSILLRTIALLEKAGVCLFFSYGPLLFSKISLKLFLQAIACLGALLLAWCAHAIPQSLALLFRAHHLFLYICISHHLEVNRVVT